jgi:mono/diheme cytochrome c family protein
MGDGPYAMLNNARPANLRDDKYKNRQVGYFFWRLSDGVPGTVMPEWKQSLSEDERMLAILFVQKAFMDMVPGYYDEGDMPAKYATATLSAPTVPNIGAGKAIFVSNCAFCHGYGGNGDGPDAAGLLPAPPNFEETSTYVDWKPGDYVWRVTDSIPMRAMPQWHTWLDAEQVRLVSGYVKNMLIFPDPKNEPKDPDIPDAAKGLKSPPTNVMRGRQVYLQRCWMCHGDAGQGEGPDGTHLAPTPANFTEPDLKKFPDAEWYWKVSHGIGNAAMPQWQLLLSEEDRWDAIAYIKATFVFPSEPKDVSDDVPPAYQAIDPVPFSPTPAMMEQGKTIYEERCLECHGKKAKGDGPNGTLLMPTPANLTEDPAVSAGLDFWYWRIDAGVVGDNDTHPTAMPAWRNIFTEQEKWAVTFYARKLAGAKGGPGGDQ